MPLSTIGSNQITDGAIAVADVADGSVTTAKISDDAVTGAKVSNTENFFIGNTAEFVDGTGTGDKGIQLNPLGLTVSTRNGGISGIFGRQASDGTIVQFRKNGSEVGRIGYASATNIAFGNASKGIGVGTSSVFPTDGGTAISDAGLDLGYANSRFKDIYLSSGVRVGGTGTANLLDDYEEGTWTPTGTNLHSTSSGKYTKIGNIVHIHGTFRTNGTDLNLFGGLPFTPVTGNANGNGACGHVGAFENSSTVNTGDSILVNTSSQFFVTVSWRDAGNRISIGQYATVGFTGSYKVS